MLQLPDNNWSALLAPETRKDYWKDLNNFLDQQPEYYPERHSVFKALELTPPEKVRAAIIGQDPYHGIGQAMGLSFSVKPTVPWPPSLRNILKEWSDDLNYELPACGDLTAWTKNVLLLNSVLTVAPGQAGSHQNQGWEKFTDAVIKNLADNYENIVFIAWGKHAENKTHLVGSGHLVLTAPHPSPLSAYRGFLGSKPFSSANAYLEKHGKEPVDWSL
jgi:uracil-DNA glycosylase